MRPTLDETADSLVGKPYLDRGRGPAAYDCFGLFLALARSQGYELLDPFTPESVEAGEYRRLHMRFRKLHLRFNTLKPLDLVFFQRSRLQHVVTVLEGGFCLDTTRQTGAIRRPLRESIGRSQYEVYRLKCRQGLSPSRVS